MQSLFGAGLLLTLAFSLDEHPAAPAQAKIQLACDDGGFSPAMAVQRDVGPCRETDSP